MVIKNLFPSVANEEEADRACLRCSRALLTKSMALESVERLLPGRRVTAWVVLRWCLTGGLLGCWLFCGGLVAQEKPTEDDVKAAYLFNFGKFVRWSAPAGGAQSFDICVVGQDGIAQVLQRTTLHEQMDSRPVAVRRLASAADARGCAVLFLGGAEDARIEKDVAALAGADVLTVSDAPRFLERGGMIQFLLENNRVRFAVNLGAVDRTRLQLSSELLKVAVSVTGARRGEGTR
jgi:hypothetical protein